MNKDTTTTTSGAAIQRYKIGYHADEWGQRSSTPSGIPDASGSWVRYADHVNALAAGQATAAQQGVAYAALPEPLEIDWPELHSQALGCGVEDRGLHNRYECAEYGWQDGVDKCADRVPEQIFDADQMRAFADATHTLRASHGQAQATAPAARVQEDAARLTSEQEHAIRQGHEIAASDRYFETRPQIDSNDRRNVFQAGFERGWDAARKQGEKQ